MPSESSPISGDFGAADGDEFAGTIAGQLGWTSAVVGTGAANTALSTTPALAAILKFSGGVISVVGTTATGIAANELLGMTLNNANGMGVDIDWLCAFDTALPTATNSYIYMVGVFDSSGAVTTGNFIGLSFGYNPITNVITPTWGLAADTVAHLIASTPGAVYLPFTSPQPVNLDVPQACRVRINNAWSILRGSVNGVDGLTLVTAAAAGAFPASTPVAFPNITNGWLGFKMFATAGTANTGKAVMDVLDFALPGRVQFS